MADNAQIKLISLEDLTLFQQISQEKIDKVDKELSDKIALLNGTAEQEGSVAKAVADAKTEVLGKVGDTAELETAAKGNLVEALNEVRDAVNAGGTAAAITLTTAETATEGAAKTYVLKQGEDEVGKIDIPKDLVVESGTIVTLAEGEVAGQAAGTYIKLVLANSGDVLYINVGTLIDIYKAEENATQIQLTIDQSTNTISAKIVAGSVGTAELADGVITTVKIADGNVTKAKLHADVQASLEKADSADANAQGYANAAQAAAEATAAADATAKANAAKEAAATDATNKANQVLADAKAYADGLYTIATEEEIRGIFATAEA